MTVAELMRELQKYDQELPVFIDGLLEIDTANSSKRIKFKQERYLHAIINPSGTGITKVKLSRFTSMPMNSSFPKAILISRYPDHIKKSKP